MGIRNTAAEDRAAMFDSTTGFAFGPIFNNEADLDDFLEWFDHQEKIEAVDHEDLRRYNDDDLRKLVEAWEKERLV